MNKRKTEGKKFALYNCNLGYGAVISNDSGLVEVILPFDNKGKESVLHHVTTQWPGIVEGGGITKEAAQLLAAYFAGQRIEFDLPIDKRLFTVFQKDVYDHVSQIPYGEVRTYGEIAGEIGRPAAARGIGTAMAANPLPIIIPCHRVVGASGCLTGYSGPGGIDSKAWLLRLEGVRLDISGKVSKM